jgi:hypothetical protein
MTENQDQPSQHKPFNVLIQLNDEISISKRVILLIIFTGSVLLVLVAVGSYRVGMSRGYDGQLSEEQMNTTPAPRVSQSTTDMQLSPQPSNQNNGAALSDIPQVQSTVPASWQVHTDTDPQYGLTTTLATPPGFTFAFTGSEWTLSDTQGEIWHYQTSLEMQEDGSLENTYDAGSRRVWYQNYLQRQASSNARPDVVTNVEEYGVAGTTYLAILVTPSYLPEAPETHYLYYQNGLMHILRPSSARATSPNAVIPQNIGPVLSSLEVSYGD